MNSWHVLVWTPGYKSNAHLIVNILTDSNFAFLVPQMIYLHYRTQIISNLVNTPEIHPALSEIAKFISLSIFARVYRRYHELVHVGFSLLHKCLSEPEFYGDLVSKFKRIMGRTDFSYQFLKVIICHKRIGYNSNVLRQSACLVINTITIDNFAAL